MGLVNVARTAHMPVNGVKREDLGTRDAIGHLKKFLMRREQLIAINADNQRGSLYPG